MNTGPLSRRGLVVTQIGLGCAPLGNLYSAVSDGEAAATLDYAWKAGIRLYDTAPLYGHGLSEQRVGRALRGRPREQFVLASKVGRLLRPAASTPAPSVFAEAPPLEPQFDFSRDGVLRSIDDSLTRLGLDRLDIVHVHDPDDHEQQALIGAFPALIGLREQGVISAVGCGMNQAAMLDRFVQHVDLDCVLLAGRYTLLDCGGADTLLGRCVERGIGVIVGGVFNSGLLADPVDGSTFDYEPAPPSLVAQAKQLAQTCAGYGVPLAAAAVQFPTRHQAVTAVLIGARSAEELAADVAFARHPIPGPLWDDLARTP